MLSISHTVEETLEEKKNQQFAHHNYRSINSFTTMTNKAIHIISHCQEQYHTTVNVSIKACICTSDSDMLHFKDDSEPPQINEQEWFWYY